MKLFWAGLLNDNRCIRGAIEMGKDKLNVALFNSKGTSTIEPSYGSAKGLSL
jgi:hypothetical protein